MTFIYRDDPHTADSGLMGLLDRLQAGDCIEVESFSCAAGSGKAFLELMEALDARGIRFRSTREQFDTAAPEARSTLDILKAVSHIGEEPAARKEPAEEPEPEAQETDAAGDAPKGRRPINVDPEAFDSILKRWRSGEITAKQAMNELGLKPNTFYRRVREKVTDVNGEEILNAARKLGKDFAQGVQQEAADFQESAEAFAAEHDLESISQTVLDQVGKSINTAGLFLNRSLELLTREITGAVERFEAQVREEAARQPAADEAAAQEADFEPAEQEAPAQEAAGASEEASVPHPTAEEADFEPAPGQEAAVENVPEGSAAQDDEI